MERSTKPFVFENVPQFDNRANFLKNYFESVLRKDVKALVLFPAIPDRTLVTFNDDCLDIDDTNETLRNEPLLKTCLRVAKAVQQNAVLVDRGQFGHFESYLESHVKGGKSVIHNSVFVPESDLAAVGISNPDALETVFRQKRIKVQPFFRNFHGRIQLEGNTLAENLEQAENSANSPPKKFQEPSGGEVMKDTKEVNPNLESMKTQQQEMNASKGNAKSKNIKPKSENLDLDERMWNMIEGKLVPSLFCTLKYDKHRQLLKFKGLDVVACREAIDDLLANIIKGTPLEIPYNLRAKFADLQKTDSFLSCAEDFFQRFYVQIFIQDNSIHFYGWNDKYIAKTKKEVQQRFMHTEEIDNKNGMDISHLKQIKKDLENKFMVNISWTDIEASKILIQGVHEDISSALQSLEEGMKKYKNRTGYFGFSREYALYIKKHCQKRLDSILQKVTVLFQDNRAGMYVIEYSGSMVDINSVEKALKQIQGEITIDNIDVADDFDSEMGELLSRAIIHKAPNDSFSTMQSLFEYETKCCILYDFKQESLQAKHPWPQITMNIIHGESDENLAYKWRERFNACIIDAEYSFNSPFIPENLDLKLEEKLSRNVVIVMKKFEAQSRKCVLKFRGLIEDILKIKAFIAEEVQRDLARNTHIISEHSPPRGTVEFVDYASGIEEFAPPYWTYQTLESLGANRFQEVEVDTETRDTIKKMLLNTFDSGKTGLGNDARGIPSQSNFEFVDVKRIENIRKYRLYHAGRREILNKKSQEREVCKSISEVSQTFRGCQLEPYLSDEMKDYLCHEINECYLLHGAKTDLVATIKCNGLDPTVALGRAILGKGVYGVECATNCDMYTDDPQNRLPSGSIHYAFLLRMLLGDIFVCNDRHPSVQRDSPKLRRPPCKGCHEDKCHCPNASFYDSVMSEGRWMYREFVVYREYLCYPEYLITYKRWY